MLGLDDMYFAFVITKAQPPCILGVQHLSKTNADRRSIPDGPSQTPPNLQSLFIQHIQPQFRHMSSGENHTDIDPRGGGALSRRQWKMRGGTLRPSQPLVRSSSEHLLFFTNSSSNSWVPPLSGCGCGGRRRRERASLQPGGGRKCHLRLTSSCTLLIIAQPEKKPKPLPAASEAKKLNNARFKLCPDSEAWTQDLDLEAHKKA